MERLIVSYTRVSHISQNTDRQTIPFTANTTIQKHYTDKVSGSIPFRERPEGAKLIRDCEAGSIGTIYFHSVCRIGRNAEDMLVTLNLFVRNNTQVIIVQEGVTLLLDNGNINPAAQIVLSVLGTLAEINKNKIKIAQAEGIAIRKLKGLYTGRKLGSCEDRNKFLNKDKSIRIQKYLDDGIAVTHIAKIADCSVNTITKVKKYRAMTTISSG